ncbi:hypothetical protein PS15m_010255 [Mucor circinelloides]
MRDMSVSNRNVNLFNRAINSPHCRHQIVSFPAFANNYTRKVVGKDRLDKFTFLYTVPKKRVYRYCHHCKRFTECVEKKRDALECPTTSAFDDVPSVEDLMELFVKSDGRCALSDATGVWCFQLGDPLSVLTLNHIKPAQFGIKFDIANL